MRDCSPPLAYPLSSLQADFDRVELEGKRRRFAEAEEELAALKAEFQGAEQVWGNWGRWRGGVEAGAGEVAVLHWGRGGEHQEQVRRRRCWLLKADF